MPVADELFRLDCYEYFWAWFTTGALMGTDLPLRLFRLLEMFYVALKPFPTEEEFLWWPMLPFDR